jgi:hypothetical protein
MGLCFTGHSPIRLQGWLLQRSRPELGLHVRVPTLSRTHPLVMLRLNSVTDGLFLHAGERQNVRVLLVVIIPAVRTFGITNGHIFPLGQRKLS